MIDGQYDLENHIDKASIASPGDVRQDPVQQASSIKSYKMSLVFATILGIISYLLVPLFVMISISSVLLMYADSDGTLASSMFSLMLIIALGYFVQGTLLFVFKNKLKKNHFNVNVVKKIKKQLQIILVFSLITVGIPVILMCVGWVVGSFKAIESKGLEYRRDIEINPGSSDN